MQNEMEPRFGVQVLAFGALGFQGLALQFSVVEGVPEEWEVRAKALLGYVRTLRFGENPQPLKPPTPKTLKPFRV